MWTEHIHTHRNPGADAGNIISWVSSDFKVAAYKTLNFFKVVGFQSLFSKRCTVFDSGPHGGNRPLRQRWKLSICIMQTGSMWVTHTPGIYFIPKQRMWAYAWSMQYFRLHIIDWSASGLSPNGVNLSGAKKPQRNAGGTSSRVRTQGCIGNAQVTSAAFIL